MDKKCVLCGEEIYKKDSCKDCYDRANIRVGDIVRDGMTFNPDRRLQSFHTIEVIFDDWDGIIYLIDSDYLSGLRYGWEITKILDKDIK